MAVFGLKYYAEMRSKYQGITWRCDIAQRGYTGPSGKDGRFAFLGGRKARCQSPETILKVGISRL